MSRFWHGVLCILLVQAPNLLLGQTKEIPEPLVPWRDWVMWDDPHVDCPSRYNDAATHVCFWPARLTLQATPRGATWRLQVSTMHQTWLPVPGDKEAWPQQVQVDGKPIPVIAREGVPSIQLPKGTFEVAGIFAWDTMPQKIAVPMQIGLLDLSVHGQGVPIPNWDAEGNVWLQRIRAEESTKDLVSAQVYRVVEDGVPLWLRTQVELTVSGKSREEELGTVLPEGWKLATINSPLPVAVDDQGKLKAQVRAGKWTISLDAFRTSDPGVIRFAADQPPLTASEWIAFRPRPDFRAAELVGIPIVDVTQTTFPEPWRNLSVYEWPTDTSFQLVEKMRGQGVQRPGGLSISRRFWLDENDQSWTYRDQLQGTMQQNWRLDVAEGQDLGMARVDGQGELITKNPQTGAEGIEVRTRNLNLVAIGKANRNVSIPATGWQQDMESLQMTLTLPPGWRAFAIWGPDHVEGAWLAAWDLLDLFLLLVFAMAVFRLHGLWAGLIAGVAFGLSYHDVGSPRWTWFLLLIPLALLRVVTSGTGHRVITIWKYIAVTLLLLNLIPFVAGQIQSVIYPQLEFAGLQYQPRRMLTGVRHGYDVAKHATDLALESMPDRGAKGDYSSFNYMYKRMGNMAYAPEAKIQTGPAEPQWSWNEVHCTWQGPVAASQTVQTILISRSQHRVFTVVRVLLLGILVRFLLGGWHSIRFPWTRMFSSAAGVILAFVLAGTASGEIPDAEMLNQLRQRILQPSDAFPHAAEIASAKLQIDGSQIRQEVEIHAPLDIVVPLPGRLPVWSPITLELDGKSTPFVARDGGYLWVVVPKGVHHITVDALLPETSDWEWTFQLVPRRVEITAPDWKVTGVSPQGVPEPQVIFARQQQLSAGQAAYDRRDFNAIVAVKRYVETGLVWRVRNEVTRLSEPGKGISLSIPLLAGESVLTSGVNVSDGQVEIRLGANEPSMTWESELPVGADVKLSAPPTDQWVERWHLISSPVWNVVATGLEPMFEASAQDLIPVWSPWPGESVTLSFRRPEPIQGAVLTVQKMEHLMTLGSRQRNSKLTMEVECSVGSDFVIAMSANDEMTSLLSDSTPVPVRRDGDRLFVPVHPGKQTVEIQWRTETSLSTVTNGESIELPVEASNITTVVEVPMSRWILWAEGPLHGPAVRFWTVLVCAILAALVLGSLPGTPLRRWEWVLLAIGLTQVHVAASLLVVLWLFLLSARGKRDLSHWNYASFDIMQLGLIFLTLLSLGILLVVIGEGLLGRPSMFILGNNSSYGNLRWFEPHVPKVLPQPSVISISMLYYQLLMLAWALWLATSLLRWLTWGWAQFTHGGAWRSAPRIVKPRP